MVSSSPVHDLGKNEVVSGGRVEACCCHCGHLASGQIGHGACAFFSPNIMVPEAWGTFREQHQNWSWQ